MSNETIEVQANFLNEMASAYVEGADTMGEAVNVIEQIIDALNSEEAAQSDFSEITRICQQSVMPMMQSVRIHFTSLDQKIKNYGQEPAITPFRPGEMMQVLANGEDTVQGTLDVLTALSEGLKEGELTGGETKSLEDACNHTHLPSLKTLHGNFGELHQALAALGGSTEADKELKEQIATAFSSGHLVVEKTVTFLEDIAGRISRQELAGPESEIFEGALRTSLIPALRAVSERMSGLHQEVSLAV